MKLSELLGTRHDNIDIAREFVISGQVVVTDNNQSFYVVNEELFHQKLFQLDYKIV